MTDSTGLARRVSDPSRAHRAARRPRESTTPTVSGAATPNAFVLKGLGVRMADRKEQATPGF